MLKKTGFMFLETKGIAYLCARKFMVVSLIETV